MSKATVDLDRCQPDRCPGGVCAARTTCAVRAISQEDPFEPPILDWSRCRACSKCLPACPARAIFLVS